MQALRLLLHRLEKGDIERRGIAGEILGVGRGKGLCVLLEQLQGIGFVEARQQRRLESVQPRTHRRGDAPFKHIGIDARLLARRGARDDVDAGKIRFGDLHL